jgi:hypothetical protein
MHTAILLDGSKNPISILLDPKTDGRPPSLSWGGSATTPAKHFNFVRSVVRDKGQPEEKEVLIYKHYKLNLDAPVLGLRATDGHVLSVGEQGELMADEFLYPEKYVEVGVAAAA